MDGKAQTIDLVEQAITTYDQREEWCAKLDALKEKAAIDYRKHCLASVAICVNAKPESANEKFRKTNEFSQLRLVSLLSS